MDKDRFSNLRKIQINNLSDLRISSHLLALRKITSSKRITIHKEMKIWKMTKSVMRARSTRIHIVTRASLPRYQKAKIITQIGRVRMNFKNKAQT